jgi:hypothetical protein
MVPVILVFSLSQPSAAYSVLTHEQIADLVWTDSIVPLLLKKYPGITAEQLRVAHGYTYGGCLIHDMGYYPFGNRFFSDLVHYVRSGDFIAALLTEAQDVNEYAFALGALAHYASDITGHPAVNAAVSQEFPELKAKFGRATTFAEDPKAHIRTEFGFDVVQVAKNRYTSDAYHEFIGFQVSKPVLERAFLKTYDIELKDVFGSLDLSIGTFRFAIGSVIPEMTRVALLLKKAEMVKEDPSFAKKRFLYNLKRADFEREWGKNYKKPGTRARIFAALFRLMPKIGPLRALKFKMPSPQTETVYLQSVNATVVQYRIYLRDEGAGTLVLANIDFDTGKPTRAGEYQLTDDAYARLLGRFADAKFTQIREPLRQNLLAFYADPNGIVIKKRKANEWNKTLTYIEQLRLVASPVVVPAATP